MNACNIKICGESVAWGVRPEFATMTILNVPAGATLLRRRFRPKSVGVAYVRSQDGAIQRYYLNVEGKAFQLGALVGINKKEVSNG